MKRTMKTIGIIAAMGVMLACAYLFGTTQAETITEIQTVTETREVIPEGYINTNSDEFFDNYIDMRQVTDFTVNENGIYLYMLDGSGYYWER